MFPSIKPTPDDGLLDEIKQICQYTLYSVNDFHLAITVLQEYYPLSCALEETQLLRVAVFNQCHEIGAMVTIMKDCARFYSSVVANVNACEEDLKTEITRISTVVDIMLDSLQRIDPSVTVGIQYFRRVIGKVTPVLPIMTIGLPRDNGPYMFLSKFREFKVVEDLLDTFCRTVETCQELANYYECFEEHNVV